MSAEWKSRVQKAGRFWGFGVHAQKYRGRWRSDSPCPSDLCHDLVTGGIPHDGSRQIGISKMLNPGLTPRCVFSRFDGAATTTYLASAVCICAMSFTFIVYITARDHRLMWISLLKQRTSFRCVELLDHIIDVFLIFLRKPETTSKRYQHSHVSLQFCSL